MANLPVCLPGLQGFPVQITGWSSFQEREKLTVPNTLSFQLALKQLWNPSNTFFLNGTQYSFRELTIASGKQEGLLDVSIQPFGELHMWGVPTVATEQKQLALLSIPLYVRSEMDEFGKRFWEAIQQQKPLSTFLPQGPKVRVVQYVTCVETERSTVSLSVAYWTVGLGVSQEIRAMLTRNQALPYGIPLSLLESLGVGKALTTFEAVPDVRGTKAKRTYEVKGPVSIPYASQATLSVTTDDFKRGFRIIDGFTVKEGKRTQQSPFERQLDNYQCIKIDRQKDIKDGQLMIDPRTGTRLTDVDAEAKKNEEMEKPEATIDTGETFKFVAIVIGVIVGVLLIAVLLAVLIGFLKGRMELPGVSAAPDVSAVPAVPAAVPAAASP